MFDVEKLLKDVFDPQAGEHVIVMVDLPHDGISDNSEWRERREMAEEWREVMARLGRDGGFSVSPMLTFPATGANNADLPASGWLEGEDVELEPTLIAATLVIAMTEFSATAPLSVLADRREDFRAASMPGVLRRMQESALAADYSEVARRCQEIAEAMRGAALADVLFSTGHRCWFDLRHRESEVDDGFRWSRRARRSSSTSRPTGCSWSRATGRRPTGTASCSPTIRRVPTSPRWRSASTRWPP